MKQNDWIVAGITNPEFTIDDFLISGLNVDNTQLLPEEQYKKSPFIKEAFTKNGIFNEQDFNSFYRKKAQEFGRFQTVTPQDTFIYDPFDTRATNSSLIKSPNYQVEMVSNPTRDVTMFSNTTYSKGLSQRELAQQSKIWDTEKQEWMSETPNDSALSNSLFKWAKSLFNEPLIYAAYDEDGEHYDQYTGQTVKHKKGEYKLNQYGLPYTETLNGRSLIGKEVVSQFDLLTVDNQGINKYDFFDSDSLDKSVTGTVMKATTAIAPLLMGPYVAPIYSGILVAKEFAKTLPMLYNLTTAWFDMPEDNSVLNTLAGVGPKFTSSTSDESRKTMLNAENLVNILSDVALQWGQQKVIANSISKLRSSKDLLKQAHLKSSLEYQAQRGFLENQYKNNLITKEAFERYVGDYNKWSESTIGKAIIQKNLKDVEPIIKQSNRLGADASLVYMALVSNSDVYASMIEAGASRPEAAAVTLGSTVGMFSIDRYLGLGELFFDDLTSETQYQIRRTLSKDAKEWYDNVIKQTAKDPNQSQFNKFKNIFQSGIDYGKKHTNKFIDDLKYHSTGFVGKAVGEGLEEVGEEFITDIFKGIYELAGHMGLDTSVKNVGAFKDWDKRYGMSFLGGTLGGGVFYGINLYQNGKFNIDKTQDELIYLVRNNKTKEILETLEDWKKKGKFGSKSLSIKTTTDENNNEVFLTAETEQDSQNEFIYNRLKETVLQLENIINSNQAGLSDDDLFNNMILSEARFKNLKKYLDIQKFSYTTGYQRAYQKAVSNVIDLEAAYKKAQQTKTGLVYASDEEFAKNIATDEYLRHLSEEEKAERKSNLKRVENDLKEAKEELRKFIDGEYSLEYTEKLLFALDSHLNEDFVAMTFDQWLKKNHGGKTSESLSTSESNKYKQEYLNYKQSAQATDLDQKFSIYKRIKEQLNPALLNIQQNQDQFKLFKQKIQQIYSNEFWQEGLRQYTENDILDFAGETKESTNYINRENPEVKSNRQNLIEQENARRLEQLKNNILSIIEESGGYIDSVTRRDLKLILGSRNKDISKAIVQNLSQELIQNNTIIDTETNQIIKYGNLSDLDNTVLQLLESVDPNNLQQSENIWNSIENLIKDKYFSPYKNQNNLLNRLLSYMSDSNIGFYNQYDAFYGEDLNPLIQDQLDNGLTVDQIFDLGNAQLYSQDFESYDLKPADVAAFLGDLKSKYQDGTLNSFVWEEATFKLLDNNQEYQKDLSYYNNIFRQYLDKIKSNPIINLNNELDKRVSNINPVIDLVKSLGLSLNTNMNNLEAILDSLNSKFEEIDSVKDLTLISQEKESLEEAAYILKLAKSYLYATSATPNIISPYGHNSTLNEFAENHKDIYKDYEQLAVLSPDVASMYEQEINRYLRQIGIKDEKTGRYNQGSWLWLSNNNEIDKAQKFIRAEKAWNKACYDFFYNNSEYFKFTYEGIEYNLLEGIETIPRITENTKDALVYLNKLFIIFYNKVNDLVSKGWTYKQIWERSGLLENVTKIEDILQQKTCSLDENITEDRMTSYDKVILLTTIASMDPTKFYSFAKERVDQEKGIVPLTIQEWISRIGISQLENSDIFYQTLEYVKTKTNDSRPIIYGTYISGNAGAGKSRVIGRNIAMYNKEGAIWLSAPKESQVNTLFESTTKGIKMLNREPLGDSESLLSRMGINMDAYNQAFSLLQDSNLFDKISSGEVSSTDYFKIVQTAESILVLPNFAKFNIKKIDNAPSLIIIDEVTHLNNLELQLISEFSKINNTKLIMLGDNKQRGNTYLGRNIDREQCITIRTPNLGISLRDNNIQHQFDLSQLEDLINTLSDLDVNDQFEYKQNVEQIKSLLKNIKFKIYYQDDINGDLIVNELTSEYAQKLKGTVGYVGRNKSSTLDLLHSLNLQVTELQELDIQGQEFDYVVIDKDFDIPNKTSEGVDVLDFLQDLYTMISRGRKGSIIVDSSNKLVNTIGQNRVEFAKAEAPSILEYAGQFIQEKSALYDQILNQSKVNEEPQNKTDQKQDESTDTEDYKDKIINSNDFNINDLDFENNYYILYQTYRNNVEPVLQNGLPIEDSLDKIALWGTSSTINQALNLQKNGEGDRDYNSIILMEFSKEIFTDAKTLNDIASKVSEIEGVPSLIPSKYMKYGIYTVVEPQGEDIQTDLEQQVEPPIVDQKELQEVEIYEDELPLNTEDIPDNPILCYGNASFTGMQVEIRDNKEVWINPKTSIKRDVQIFTNKSEIADTQEQIDLTNMLRELKNSFLYNKNYSQLSSNITKVISEEDYNNINWIIEVRPKNDQDNFIRNIAFKQDKLGIGSKDLVFAVVGKVKLKDNTEGTITLGLMGDPRNWINKVPGSISRIEQKINQLKKKRATSLTMSSQQKSNIDNQIAYYQEYIKKLNLDDPKSMPRQYESYIEQLSESFIKNNPEGTQVVSPVQISIPRIITPGLTDMHKQPNIIRLSRESKSLIKNTQNRIESLKRNLEKAKGNSFARENIELEIRKAEEKLKEYEQIRDYSFRSLNPYTVVSPMYIYTPNSAVRDSLDIDDSVIGKYNVVFVTNDNSLNANELVNIYIAQKNQTELERKEKGLVDLKNSKVTPSVRMMILENMGVSFQDLSNPYLAESMKSDVSFVNSKGKKFAHKQIYPFKTNFMGVRMYVSLWNFRANLLQFTKQFDRFTQSLPIDRSNLDVYLTVKDLLWRKENNRQLSNAEENFLIQNQNLENFDEVSKLIDEFNDFLGNKVKEFRLGGELYNGAYIRYLTGDLTSLYKYDETKTKISGIYLNSKTSIKYLDIVESLFTNVLDYIITSDYPKDRLLSTKEGVKNSFANHIKSLANSNGVVEILDAFSKEKLTCNFGAKQNFDSGVFNTFSHIPAVLSKVFKFTSIRQSHITGNRFDLEDEYSIKLIGTVEVESEGQLIQKQQEVKIPYNKLWTHIDMIEAADEYDIDAIEGHVFDPTLSNFFSLAFHGTLEDINSDAQRASDALFPKGFFADPLSTTEIVYNGSNKMFTKSIQQQIFFGSNVRMGDPTFFISLNEIEQAVEDLKKPQIVETNQELLDQCINLLNNTLAAYPQLQEEINIIKTDLNNVPDSNKKQYVTSSISSSLDSVIQKNTQKVFNSNNISVDPNTLILKKSDLEVFTLEQIINQLYQEKYGEQLQPIDSIQAKGRTLTITCGDTTLTLTKGLNNNMSISKIGGVVSQESEIINTLEGLKTILDKHLKESQKKDYQKIIDTYSNTPEDTKSAAKEIVKKKLMRLKKDLERNKEVRDAITTALNKLKEPNCI